MATMRLIVDPPARTLNPFGLWNTAQTVDDPDPHWRQGVEWEPGPCDEGAVTQDPCPTVPATKQPTATGFPSWCSEPFTVYSWLDCGPVGVWDDDTGTRFGRRATDLLLRGEGRAVEREFWTGANGVNPHLAATTPVSDGDCQTQTAAQTVVTGTASIAAAIGELEDALDECCGGPGVIHLPMRVVAPGFDQYQFVKVAGKLFTQAGTPVVASGAYPGTSPAGAVPTGFTSWVYGTGPVVVRRGPARVTRPAESLDRALNREVVIAERTYVAAFDSCLFAALATWT